MFDILVAVHLEDCPEAVALGAASVASALRSSFPDVPVHLIEAFAHEGASALTAKINHLITSQAEPLRSIGFSLYSWNRSVMIESAQMIRKGHEKAFLYCGGPEVSARPEGLLRAEGGVFDVLIRGEGELAAVQVLRSLSAGCHAPSHSEEHSPLHRIDDLACISSPWLDGTLTASNHHGVLWELARGCPFACAYCYESRGDAHGKRVRYVPQDRIRAELVQFIRNQVPYVFVLDPTFNASERRAIGILDMIAEESEKFLADNALAPMPHWHFELRSELLTREQAHHFAKIDASLQIGLQTANPKAALLIGRGDFNRGKFKKKIHLLIEADVTFGLDLIYGLPGDTLADYKKSLDFALSLSPNNLDMFKLSVLPGTALWQRAAELELRSSDEAPYEIIAAPDFSAHDLMAAERLSCAADFFYNKGRAVAWFNQVLYPLGIKPHAFLKGFIPYTPILCDTTGAYLALAVENAQLAYLDAVYTKAEKQALLPAVHDIVRFNGAWGRALVEGVCSDINFHYHPEAVLRQDGLDIASFASSHKTSPSRARVEPAQHGPVWSVVNSTY